MAQVDGYVVVRSADEAIEAASLHSRVGLRKQAIAESRQFVYSQSYATLNTIQQSGPLSGYPTGQIEYYVDNGEHDASLLLIHVDVSTAFRNIDRGSPCSLSIRVGDAPGATSPCEAAAARRIVLYGKFSDTEPSQTAIDRFFEAHPDAVAWRPGTRRAHKTKWVRFEITSIHYIGGFGDKHYIGSIPVDKYVAAPVKPQAGSILSRWAWWLK